MRKKIQLQELKILILKIQSFLCIFKINYLKYIIFYENY